MSAVLPLAELLQIAGVSSFELAKKVFNKAGTILRECDQYSDNSTLADNFSVDNDVHQSKILPHVALKLCIESFSSILKDVEQDKYTELGSLAVKDVCIPYLRIMSSLADSQDSYSVAAATTMNATGTLLGVLVKDGDVTLVKEILHSFEQLILSVLRLEESSDHQKEELTDQIELNSHVVISALQYVLEAATVHNIEDKECSLMPIFDALLYLLQRCDAPTCFLISGTPLPLLVSNKERAERVWNLIEAVYMNKVTVECKSHDVIFTLLCCLHTVFIFCNTSSPFISTPHKSSLSGGLNSPLFDVRRKRMFWDIVQTGLVSSDPLTRKKCMFLVNCVLSSVQNGSDESVVSDGGVFWWDKDSVGVLQAAWSDLILVLETMEEKQIHIVRPVRSHLQNVMRATRVIINERSLLHVSWLMVVLSRVFVHYEAKSIIRWGVMECLNMPLKDSPLLKREHWIFIFGPLLQVLNESVLYSGREQGTSRDTCPPVVQSLINFLTSFLEQLHPHEQGDFLSQLLSSCDSTKLADIPLFFLTYALSQLPPMPLLCSQGLGAIRSIVLNGILTHKPSLRSAIQCFLLTTTCNMTNPAGVSYLDVILTLGAFREEECLTFGSSAWKKASYFFIDYCTKRSWSATPTADALPHKLLLFDYLSECVGNCIKGKIDLSQPSPAHLARALLLVLYSECEGPSSGIKGLSTSERSLKESLTQLLAPVMDLISTAQNRAYLPQDTLHSALHLLLSLVRGITSRSNNDNQEWKGKCSATGSMLYECLLPWLPDVTIYIQGLLLEGSKDDSLQYFDSVWFYRDIVHHLFLFLSMFGLSFHETRRELSLPYVASRALGNLTSAVTSANMVIVLSPSFLGAVSALDWVLSLLSHKDDHGGNKTDESVQCYSETFSPEEIKSIVDSISSLPLLIKITKPPVLAASMQPNQLSVIAEKKPLDWGPLIASCYSSYWNCVLFAMRRIYKQPPLSVASISSPLPYLDLNCTKVTVGHCDVVQVVDACLESLDVATENLSTVIECLAILAPKLLSLNPQSFVSYVDTVWPLILEQKHDHKSFRRVLKSFLNLVFTPAFLTQGQTSSQTVEELQCKYAEEFFTLGEARTGIYNLLTAHVCDTWMQQVVSSWDTKTGDQIEVVFSSLRANSRLVLKACLFGPVHKKNLRAVEEVEVFIESLGDVCLANRQKKSRYLEDDNSVRVYMNLFLMQLATMCTAAEASVRLRELYKEFLKMFVTLLLDELANISAERPKYYINSHTHRVKLRLLQALLLALNWIGQDVARLIVERLLQALQFDNQLSVRYLLEWILVLVFTQHSHLLDKFFYHFLHSETEKRLSRMCSIFTIAAHVGCSLKTPAEQMTFYPKVFPAVYQWTASHHFIARLYSQRAVFKMWDALLSTQSPVAEQFSIFETCISFMKENGDGKKFSHKLDENFFFSKMEPCRDVNIETIFHLLPYLCHVTVEELVTLRHFQAAVGAASWSKGVPLTLECDNSWLLQAVQHKMSELAQQQPEETGSSTRSIAHRLKSSTSNGAVEAPSSGDVQKKLTPWSNNPAGIIPDLFPESSSLDRLSVSHAMGGERDSCTSGLILVASLLSKTPNLGGLCRTSQIFGLSEVVISNKKVMEETQFQSISVTAEKWLTVTEVKLPVLRDYLLDMQRKGYALVGVEQTAHSKCITQYRFKHKTLLLLGNEREGIPVELIHLLEDCVEIPQFGTIRSLNVHVSGAIVIWEYTKQHLIGRDLIPG